MYHAQDQAVDVPRTETTGQRGGIHNCADPAPDQAHSHLIGGYAQLSFALQLPAGPTGNQRDEVTTIRRRSQGGGVLTMTGLGVRSGQW